MKNIHSEVRWHFVIREIFIKAVELVSKDLGTPIPKVEFQFTPRVTYTAILPHQNPVNILVNLVWIEKSDNANIYVKTFHEMRHYYQMLLVSRDRNELKAMGYSKEFINNVDIWRKEFSSYVSYTENYTDNIFQRIEIDAKN